MKILLYIEPRIDMGKPYLREPWVDPFAKDMIGTLKNSAISKDWECCITLNEPLRRKYDGIEGISKKYFTQEELFPSFVGDWLDISVAWYYGTYTEEQMVYYVQLIKEKFDDFIPDIVITFSPAPYLQQAFPHALVFNHEVSFFSRAPYPLTWYLDPLGMCFSHSSFLNRYKENIQNIQLSSSQKEILNDFKRRSCELVRSRSPFDELIQPLKDKFDYLVLLPLTRLDTYSFYGRYKDKFKNQYQYIETMMNRIPENIGVIVVPHPDYIDLIDDETIDYVRDKYPNLIFHEDIQKYQAPSQYLMSYVDLFIGEASSLCFQTMLWENKLINIGSIELIADSTRIEEIEDVLQRERQDRDNILYWLLTRYAVNKSYFHNPEWLPHFLMKSFQKFRNEGINFNFYEPIDKDERIFEALSNSLNENIPQINPRLSYDRLKASYESLKASYESLKAEYDELVSKDLFLLIQDVIKSGEKLFQEGRVEEAHDLFSRMLGGINKFKGDLLNNLAVIHAHEGRLDQAEWILNYLIKEGYESEEAEKNLEMIRNLRVQGNL